MAGFLGVGARLQMRNQLRYALSDTLPQTPVISMPAPGLHSVHPFDFSLTPALIDDARSAAATLLSSLEVDGPGLYGEPHARYPRSAMTVSRTREMTREGS